MTIAWPGACVNVVHPVWACLFRNPRVETVVELTRPSCDATARKASGRCSRYPVGNGGGVRVRQKVRVQDKVTHGISWGCHCRCRGHCRCDKLVSKEAKGKDEQQNSKVRPCSRASTLISTAVCYCRAGLRVRRRTGEKKSDCGASWRTRRATFRRCRHTHNRRRT